MCTLHLAMIVINQRFFFQFRANGSTTIARRVQDEVHSLYIRTVLSKIAVAVDGVSYATPNDPIWRKPCHRTDI